MSLKGPRLPSPSSTTYTIMSSRHYTCGVNNDSILNQSWSKDIFDNIEYNAPFLLSFPDETRAKHIGDHNDDSGAFLSSSDEHK